MVGQALLNVTKSHDVLQLIREDNSFPVVAAKVVTSLL